MGKFFFDMLDDPLEAVNNVKQSHLKEVEIDSLQHRSPTTLVDCLEGQVNDICFIRDYKCIEPLSFGIVFLFLITKDTQAYKVQVVGLFIEQKSLDLLQIKRVFGQLQAVDVLLNLYVSTLDSDFS